MILYSLKNTTDAKEELPLVDKMIDNLVAIAKYEKQDLKRRNNMVNEPYSAHHYYLFLILFLTK